MNDDFLTEQGSETKSDILIGPETLSAPFETKEPADPDYRQGDLARLDDATVVMPVLRPSARTWAKRIFGVSALVFIAAIELGLLLRMQSNSTLPSNSSGMPGVNAGIDSPVPVLPTPFIVVPTPLPPPAPVWDPGSSAPAAAPAPAAPAPASAGQTKSTSPAPPAPPSHGGKGGKGGGKK